MQSKKNKRLMLVWLLCLAATLAVAFWPQPSDRLAVERDLFALKDTAALTEITLARKDTTYLLQREGAQWTINRKYPVDPNILSVFISILHDVAVFRPVGQSEEDNVRDFLLNQGVKMTAFGSDGVLTTYYAGGYQDRNISYFMREGGAPYRVHLPGYPSFVAGLYQMPANDWRRRALVATSWTGLSQVTIDYANPQVGDLNFVPSGMLFTLEGLPRIDTNAVMDYVSRFSYFEVDLFVDQGEYPQYDSLLNTPPVVQIEVTTVQAGQNARVRLWPLLPGENYRLGQLANGQRVLFDDRRIRWIFRSREYFKPRSL